MKTKQIYARFFGRFQMTCGNVSISGGRSYRAWPILSYLAYHHGRDVTHDELVRLFADMDRISDPAHFMRVTIHRIRKILEPIVNEIGSELVLTKQGAYKWNEDVPLSLDTEQFETALRACDGSNETQEKLRRCREALELYQGDFLSGLSGEAWVAPLAAYYREQYFDAAFTASELMIANGLGRDAEAVCRRALDYDAYHEPLNRQLIRALITVQDYSGAVEAYKVLSQRLYDELGVLPDAETRRLYQAAAGLAGGGTVTPEELTAQLREENPSMGALVCTYEDFRRFYQAEARSAGRRGDAVHIAILSVTAKNGDSLSERVLRNAMEQLEQNIRRSLRLGDVAAACSASQYVLMLLQANLENSEKVLERITRSFYREHPHTSAILRCAVLPIEPLDEFTTIAT